MQLWSWTVVFLGLAWPLCGDCANTGPRVKDVPHTGGLQLEYGEGNTVTYNEILTKDFTKNEPTKVTVVVGTVLTLRLVLVMADPDAPYKPKTRTPLYFLHWLVQGSFPGNGTFLKDINKPNMPYTGPDPPPCDGEYHRYQVLVFQLREQDSDPEIPESRGGFTLDPPLTNENLVASTQFRVKCPPE